MFVALNELLRKTFRKGWEDVKQQEPESFDVLDRVYLAFQQLAQDFNSSVSDSELTVKISPPHAALASDGHSTIRRCIFNNAFWAISIRANESALRIYLLRSVNLPEVSRHENYSNLRLSVEAGREAKGTILSMSDTGFAITVEELRVMILAVFNDLIARSKSETEFGKGELRLVLGDKSLATAVRELLFDKQRLSEDLLKRIEEQRSQIMMDIHDDVLSDLVFSQRMFALKANVDDKALNLLDQAIRKLRALCKDLTCRDLEDWGLEFSLRDLASKLSEQSEATVEFSCDKLPVLPKEICLQIYRIVQESMNNALKHAHASEIKLQIRAKSELTEFEITDNGKGFPSNLSQPSNTGSGLKIINERMRIITSIQPAQLFVRSDSNGTSIVLQVHNSI